MNNIETEIAAIDPAISAQDLLSLFHAKQLSGGAFYELAYSRTVDIDWLKQRIQEATNSSDWSLLCKLLPFAATAKDAELNPLLGQALRKSFDHIVQESPSAVWGTPELIVDTLTEDDSRVIEDLAYVCCIPPNMPDGWYLDYRKAVDLIQRTASVPTDARVFALQGILGRSEIDAYVQEAINALSKRASREV